MPGMAVEIVYLIANYLNLTVDIVKVVDRVPGWTTAFDEVYNNETDVYALFFGEHTATFTAKYDFTKPILWDKIKVLIKRPDHSFKSIFDFFQMYSLNVWLSVLAVFVLFTVFGVLVQHVECKLKLREQYKVSEIFWNMTGIQLTKFHHINYKLLAGKIALLIFLVFQIRIVVALYESLILTRIIKKVDSTAFAADQFTQLIKEKKLTLVIEKKTSCNWTLEGIRNNLESPFYELREALEVNPYRLVDNVLETLAQESGTATLYVEHWLYKHPNELHCDLELVDALFLPQPQRFMFKKGNQFAKMFNEAIDVNVYQIRRIVRKYRNYEFISRCPSKNTGPIQLCK
ncbi:hypothetical protein M3Y95_00916900 [Aphelenchoides besseyi]|nr:hypothetical protein M3Y95_00916900 [Aphelenchoides besseyi]